MPDRAFRCIAFVPQLDSNKTRKLEHRKTAAPLPRFLKANACILVLVLVSTSSLRAADDGKLGPDAFDFCLGNWDLTWATPSGAEQSGRYTIARILNGADQWKLLWSHHCRKSQERPSFRPQLFNTSAPSQETVSPPRNSCVSARKMGLIP